MSRKEPGCSSVIAGWAAALPVPVLIATDALPTPEQLQRHSGDAPGRWASARALAIPRAWPDGDVGEFCRELQLDDSTSRPGRAIAQHHRGLPLRRRMPRALDVVREQRRKRVVTQRLGAVGDVEVSRVERDRNGVDGRTAQRVVRLALEERAPRRPQ